MKFTITSKIANLASNIQYWMGSVCLLHDINNSNLHRGFFLLEIGKLEGLHHCKNQAVDFCFSPAVLYGR